MLLSEPGGRLEGLSHVPLLSSCLPQSDNASEEAGEGEYVNLCSSGQSSEELAHSRGVSSLGAASCMRPAGRAGPGFWLSLPVPSRPAPWAEDLAFGGGLWLSLHCT